MDFLQVLDIDRKSESYLRKLPDLRDGGASKGGWRGGSAWRNKNVPAPLYYDPEWLALQKINHENLSFSFKTAKAIIRKPTRVDMSFVIGRLKTMCKQGQRKSSDLQRHEMLLPLTEREGGGQGG